jgi:tRNA(His) 5'-end guanylyltransferase
MACTQSDEITLVLSDFDLANSEAWFDGNLQKTVSVASSMATMLFNRARMQRSSEERGAFLTQELFRSRTERM